jgi:GTP-binding protein EngB required for normal cell division
MQTEPIIAMASELTERFCFNDLLPLLNAIRSQTQKSELSLAVFGRFKAGKSSFLNSVLGRSLLPVGVTPLTATITEIGWGAVPYAEVLLADGSGTTTIPIESVGDYIPGNALPSNTSDAPLVRILLPGMARFRGLWLVDTPGLESVFSQNTKTTVSWSPNIDLALVAVAADPPLMAQDVALLERLLRFTPNVAVLLTKMDTLDSSGQTEVRAFVEARLRERFPKEISVFPFSVRAGFEHLRRAFQTQYLDTAVDGFHAKQHAVLTRKLNALLNSLADYLRVALAVACARDQDRAALFAQAVGTPEEHSDLKLNMQLIARHACAHTRAHIEQNVLANLAPELSRKLRAQLDDIQSAWHGGLAQLISQFEEWLRKVLRHEMSLLSRERTDDFLHPLRDAERQFVSLLQDWREQLSQRVERLCGTPLRMTQEPVEVQPPNSPDISVGRVYDHNWELPSAVIPIRLLRAFVMRRFAERIDAEVHKNLSRLTAQWEEITHTAIRTSLQKPQEQFGELLQTVRNLLSNESARSVEEIESSLGKINAGLQELASLEDSEKPDSGANRSSIL